MKILNALGTVISAIFGVSSAKSHQQRLEKVSPAILIFAATIVFLAIILILFLAVNVVTH